MSDLKPKTEISFAGTFASSAFATYVAEPRIADFGLSRFLPDDWSYLSTTVARTLYSILRPEFIMEQHEKPGGSTKYSCKLQLPCNAPFEKLEGPVCSSMRLVQQAVCLAACKKVHEMGAGTSLSLKEEHRARDLFYALWDPDLFMKRVNSNGEWSLFCPNEVPGLSDCWGEEFEELYTRYEREECSKRTIKKIALGDQ